MTNCPDCSRPVETSQMDDPDGPGEPVTIWDCSWCQRSGFVPAPVAPFVWPEPAHSPVLRIPAAGGPWSG